MKWPKSGEIPSRFSQIPSDSFYFSPAAAQPAAALFRKFFVAWIGLESSLRLADGDHLVGLREILVGLEASH